MHDTEIESIPADQTSGFPAGVSEVKYGSKELLEAFLEGLHFADDIDVISGEPFERGGEWVVRVCVGEWDDDEDDES